MSLTHPQFLLCSRPASINWTDKGPVSRPASRLCIAVPSKDCGEMAELLRTRGYLVEEVPGQVVESVSL